jgi:hypothetical protein
MRIRIRKAESLQPEAIGAFLEASQSIEFADQSREEIYGWVKTVSAGVLSTGQEAPGCDPGLPRLTH